jgi:hypothetical protein
MLAEDYQGHSLMEKANLPAIAYAILSCEGLKRTVDTLEEDESVSKTTCGLAAPLSTSPGMLAGLQVPNIARAQPETLEDAGFCSDQRPYITLCGGQVAQGLSLLSITDESPSRDAADTDLAQKADAWMAHVEDTRHAAWIQICLWYVSVEESKSCPEDPQHKTLWLPPSATVGHLRNTIVSACGLTHAKLYVASTEVVIDEKQSASTHAGGTSSAAARPCQPGKVIWGRLMMQPVAWDDEQLLRTGAHLCSGAHVLALPGTEEELLDHYAHQHLASSNSLVTAAAGSPVTFVVSVNLPKTQDFSIDLMAHPWSTLGESLVLRPHNLEFVLCNGFIQSEPC